MQGGHAFAVHSVAFSPDGGLIASAGAEGTVKLWRAADGALLRTLTGHDGDVNGVAFSPNGSYVASAGADGTVRVWRTQDGRLLHTLVGEGGIVLSVAFAPDSQLVASGSEDGRVKLWRVSTGALERTIPAHDLWVSSVAFSPSGGVLASASADGTVKLWQVANGQPVGDIQAHALWVTHIAFSPNGQLLASAGEDGTVKLWRVSDMQLVRTLSYSDAAPVYGVAFSADGSLVAAGGGENIIKIWRVSDGGLQRSLAGHAAQVSSIAFAPSSPVLASSGGDGAIKLWRTTDGALLATLTGHTAQVASVAFAPNRNLLASGSGDTTVRLWRATDGGLERILRAHDFGVTSVAFSTDGQLLASGSEDGVVKLWRTVDGGQARTILAHAAAVTRVCFSPNGSLLATASEDGTIKLWRVVDGVLQRTINNAHLGYVSDVVFSPDGTLLASAGEDAQVKVWRIADGGLQRELTGHTAPVTSVAFSPNGSLIASGSVDTTVKIWRVFDGALTATLAGHTEPVYTLAFAPGGNLLASGGGDGVINLWRVSDGTRLRSYSQETGTGVLAIAFSPDGQLFGYGRLDATIVVARNPFPPNRPPAVPELVAPADGATVSPTPTLRVRLSDPDNDPVQAVIEISDASGVVRTLETGLVASGSEASVSVDPPLTAGSYSWRARARDSAGNTSDWSNTRAFTVQPPPNNRPPAVPELVAPADGATVSPAPTLRVRLSDPDNDQVQAVIEISDASGVVRTLETGFVASGSEASVSVDPSLAAGSYTWRARARDSAGNTSDWSNTRAFTVQPPPNNRPPAVPELVAPADGATVSPTPTLRVRLSDPDNDPVQAVIEVRNGSGVVRTLETGLVASGSEASVSVDPSLEAGDYTWRARAKDSAGNASEWSAPRAFTVQPPPNNRPPAVPELVAPADGATVSPTPTLRVRLSDPDNDPVQAVIEVRNGSGVVRTLETGLVASGSEASVSVDPSLEAGDYTWRARAKDSAGNASEWSAPRAFTVQPPPNNRPPAVPELVAPADGATVSPTPTLRVRLSDPDGDQVQAVIEVRSGSGVVRTLETGFVASGSEASVSVDPSLEAGDYSWRARAKDSAGNASEWSSARAFTVETPPNNRPPAVPELLEPADGATVSPTPTLRVRLSDPDNDQVQAVIEVRNGSGVVRTLETGFVASGSEASVSVGAPLAAGDYTWRARARDRAGNTSEWSAPRRIVISTSVPSRLVGIRTFALSLRTPTNDPNALGLNGMFIARWDAAAQQYAQATQLRAGEAYFIKAINPVQPNLFGEPITGEITIPLKPGWNLIANPTLAPIEWRLDGVLVQRGSERRSLRAAQQAGWLDGYLWAWRQDPNNPMRGQYQFVYDASELQGVAGTLEPWQAYWILARVECTLVLNAAPSRAVDVLPAPSDGVWTLQVEAVNARGSGQSVWIGVAQGRSVQAMLAPEPPDGELPIQVRVRRAEGVFAADVRPTLTRDARWSLEVVVAPSDQPQPTRLRIHQATHLPRGVNLALVDEQNGARRPLRSAGASLTFTAPPEGGVFRFAIEPIARRTLLRVLNPTVRGGTRAGETLTLGFTLTAEAQVQVQIRTGSRTVRTLSDTRTRSAGLQEFIWDGRDDAGVHLPPGAYLAEITAVSADGQAARAVAPIIVRR
jgi:WD40 repeat protein